MRVFIPSIFSNKYLIALLILVMFLFSWAPSSYAAKKDILDNATIGENISGGFADFYIQSKDTFNSSSREILWFAHFKGFRKAYKANLSARWYAPSGEKFKEEQFSTQETNSRYAWAKLDIRGQDQSALSLPGTWKVDVFWDDELIDSKEFYIGDTPPLKIITPIPAAVRGNLTGRNVRVLYGNKIVYDGPEESDQSVWEITKLPLTDLKVTGSDSATKSIAILAYPYKLDVVANDGFGFDRGKYMAQEILKSGLQITPVRVADNLPDQYRYVMRYSVDTRAVEVNFLSPNSHDTSRLIDYTEQYDKAGRAGSLQNTGDFPHDLSFLVSTRIARAFQDDDYRVLDLTPARDALINQKPAEILEVLRSRNIDKIMLVPMKSYTKWNGGGTVDIGLLLCYAAVVFEREKVEPTFAYTENIDMAETSYGFLGSKNKQAWGIKLNFYSEDWSEDRKIHPDRPIKFYKDGIIDDLSASTKVLYKFEHSASGKDLFQTLVGRGLLSRYHNPLQVVAASYSVPQRQTTRPGDRDLRSYYEELGIKKSN